MKRSNIVSSIAIVYFMLGFIFAIAFALYYRWPFLSFLSPGFYSVILSWPIQSIGFVRDLLLYGLAGKPI
ncbi:MAG: hypothetical protein ACD_32C00147G0005 [uncultured bacterium]|nr:MAG: hypothetical protein ACD_32C00147G0005 [uncultured bacterium]OGE21002.1 MAG: hypothetical protein A2778_05060 [Candidatus Daviesbacteria bacterium RIFCSPHIGHO2_01_FULL_40_24]OGE29126.1 MAG: hypothetical protein A3C29_04815 [Candidatus Daviesbacteria bacterium RIFCSPHIGHO2_02_FULL_40_16]OGE43081.1 MAG: hypothetical protein A3A53_00820 [Candidatus Daviesbacteria bacterium RIFCSPLOWO2_01_FULL_39_23]OGE67423.1 MAG: hypothetical protein A3J16_03740 [Candidatus Daviesbacteria bacterium RIFCSP